MDRFWTIFCKLFLLSVALMWVNEFPIFESVAGCVGLSLAENLGLRISDSREDSWRDAGLRLADHPGVLVVVRVSGAGSLNRIRH